MEWKSFSYECSVDFNTGEYVYTPAIPIKIFNGSKVFSTDGIIDSGTDCTMMSGEVADFLGIDLAKCEKDPAAVRGIISGLSGEGFFAYVKLKVDKFDDDIIDIKVTFVPGLAVPVLLGQNDFFRHFKILFVKSENVIKLSNE